MARPHPDV